VLWWFLSRDIFSPFDFGGESLFPFLAYFAFVALFDGGVFERTAFRLGDKMVVEEGPPWIVTTELHALNFGVLEGVHGNRSDKGDVDA
jgi:hypothetical protein